MTRRLIEEWLPIAELGIESVRERTPMTPFPAPNRLHVWWARHPLVASRAAILASLLPEDADHERFMHAIGIHGDPVSVKRRIMAARRRGERFEGQAYDYDRAFKHNPTAADQEFLSAGLEKLGISDPTALDPTAGGGAIPLESTRLGLRTFANDLNPVAALIMSATIDLPSVHGVEVIRRYHELADEFVQRREERLAELFPDEPESNCITTNYIWARTICCPYCDGVIPLSPNWRFAPDGTGVRVHPDPTTKRCSFEIVNNTDEQSEGTVARGKATCPYPSCGRIVDGDEVKRQAQAGGMGEQLYAIVFKRRVITRTKTGRQREKWTRGYGRALPCRGQADRSAIQHADLLCGRAV